ncbi:MAG: PQQ-binding-like beta-propeller repeat protein [Lentisphaerae bacterium]|jgi:outer membrane protein assembly factor BamB|nr:PQQ-binding-like beta-propeller repeat protein [Lentisphaerota bacterium]MBT4818962.1 PQQ-binding-like beta-propeller repeat protein [Lentisphaerota bacterium]MBT5605309.1 PQQ-binding-like beta-propeller repeat protein [Lentisphaerota bacterium]MBT7057541.1 PQQ-binding-like beta-propeller repeat protein [Lentisphaerota bacterium]MBT7840693.1 PQQ-binding-like beta-propeller repeat protein [Lentisphaerota bacterium]
MRNACLAIATAILTCHIAWAADWPQFRGPGGQGIAADEALPTTWTDTENMVWKKDLPGAGASSPIILGDNVYLTCYSGYGIDRKNPGTMDDLALHVVCIKAADGDIVWDSKVAPTLPDKPKIRDHGYSGPTPATDGKALYVFFGKSGVYKFDLAGNKIWKAEVGSGTHGWGCGTSPVLCGDLVIINASVESRSLIAFDKATGKEAWRARGMVASWNTPHVVELAGGKQELVVSVKDKLLAFDPKTGESLWTCEGIHDYVCPSIVSQDGIVYAIGGRKSQTVAVRAGGRDDVTASHRLWVANVGANVSSPVVHDGHLYWVSDRNTTAYCLKLSDGSIVYQEKFPKQPYASTVLAGGKLYVVARWGGAFVLPAKPQFEILAHNTLSDRSVFNASPAVADGKLFLRSDKALYCIGTAD